VAPPRHTSELDTRTGNAVIKQSSKITQPDPDHPNNPKAYPFQIFHKNSSVGFLQILMADTNQPTNQQKPKQKHNLHDGGNNGMLCRKDNVVVELYLI